MFDEYKQRSGNIDGKYKCQIIEQKNYESNFEKLFENTFLLAIV